MMPCENSALLGEPMSRRDFARIARRFNAGNEAAKELSPEGTVETANVRIMFNRPFGTWAFFPMIPALKRRAILIGSLRDESLLNLTMARELAPPPCDWAMMWSN